MQVELLPEDVLRRIYQHYKRARARYLWKAVSSFVTRMNVVRWLLRSWLLDRWDWRQHISRMAFSLDMLRLPYTEGPIMGGTYRSAYNIRSRRGVKRPLEDFLE